MAQTDKDVRLELSALYRILHMYGMTDLANQCAGARSAEDYVKAFVKDVNRAKVIKAKIIMKTADQANDIDKSNLIKVNEDEFIEDFLPKIVCSDSNCEVVDKSGNVKGYISNQELQSSLTRS